MFRSWEELSVKEQLECTIWDAYKDAYGFRPRHMNLSAMSEQELRTELSRLEVAIQESIAAQKVAEEAATKEFEELVQHTIEQGARTRQNAVRWIAEGCQYNGDWDMVCYEYGLPYGYFKELS